MVCLLIGLIPVEVYATEFDETFTTESQSIEVPTDTMVIQDGIYYGISKGWFAEINPDKKPIFFSQNFGYRDGNCEGRIHRRVYLRQGTKWSSYLS
ncbi:MAG: hypothetical protein K2M82_03165 [Lachnospiraceae bacterium]|nr:hypothetical protein [Lachnospiraceae bacterium]